MDLDGLKRSWDAFGRRDPMWAILTDPDARQGRWDAEQFFASGRTLVRQVLQQVKDQGLALRRRRALDFGCGMGRNSQALCEHFGEVVGVDIAASMIELARQHNRHGDGCRYEVNDRGDLARFPDASFDFVFTVLVLQHMSPELAVGYLREFLRVLRPGGVLFFQLPSIPIDPVQRGVDPARQSVLRGPLPDTACRAGFTVLQAPTAIVAGETATLRLRVHNRGAQGWPALARPDSRFQLRVANHWRRRRWLRPAKMAVPDDGRAALPFDLGPGDCAEVTLTVTAPAEPGRYFVELDVVQEWAGWFAARGGRSVRVPVTVTPASSVPPPAAAPAAAVQPSAAPAPEGPPPVMEEHGMEPADVTALVTGHGGRVVLVEDDDWCGPGRRSHHYLVVRQGI